MTAEPLELQVVLPVFNEAESLPMTSCSARGCGVCQLLPQPVQSTYCAPSAGSSQ